MLLQNHKYPNLGCTLLNDLLITFTINCIIKMSENVMWKHVSELGRFELCLYEVIVSNASGSDQCR